MRKKKKKENEKERGQDRREGQAMGSAQLMEQMKSTSCLQIGLELV